MWFFSLVNLSRVDGIINWQAEPQRRGGSFGLPPSLQLLPYFAVYNVLPHFCAHYTRDYYTHYYAHGVISRTSEKQEYCAPPSTSLFLSLFARRQRVAKLHHVHAHT